MNRMVQAPGAHALARFRRTSARSERGYRNHHPRNPLRFGVKGLFSPPSKWFPNKLQFRAKVGSNQVDIPTLSPLERW